MHFTQLLTLFLTLLSSVYNTTFLFIISMQFMYTNRHSLEADCFSRRINSWSVERPVRSAGGYAGSDVTSVQVFWVGWVPVGFSSPFLGRTLPSGSSRFPRGSEVAGPSSTSVPHPAASHRPATYEPPILPRLSRVKELFIRSGMTRDVRARIL